MNLAGYVFNQAGSAKVGLTVEVYTTAGVLTDSTTTSATGYWQFTGLATESYKVKIIDGTKVLWIDGRSEIQVTNIEAITAVATDTISERTAAAGVTIDGVLLKDGAVIGGKFGTAVLTANSGNRGKFYFTEGGAGVADLLFCVMKGADDNYSAVQVAIG
ncbi:MAG: hypothetical protein WC455_15745 [Dehalococcoidia bacterium]|jgi:hypothetical protein